MAASEDMEFRLAPAWTITQSDRSVLISGGADALYEIELENSARSFFAELTPGTTLTRRDLEPADQRVLEQLLTAEVVVPVLRKGTVLRVAVVGDAQGFELSERAALRMVPRSRPHDLAVVARSTSTYAQLLKGLDYQNMTTPHLFIDLAFHHTVSIGPLVFPGETACIACLQGRVTTRWGDGPPPPATRVTAEQGGLVAELAAAELVRIADGDTSLTNATVAWNLFDRAVAKNQLLKVPLCPVCNQSKMGGKGSLVLPWKAP